MMLQATRESQQPPAGWQHRIFTGSRSDAFFFDFDGMKSLFDTRGKRNFTEPHLGGKSPWTGELVKAGLAWWYRQYAPWDSVLERLESEARKAPPRAVVGTGSGGAVGVAEGIRITPAEIKRGRRAGLAFFLSRLALWAD